MKTVAILCGGPGSEHEISCLSAAGVLSAIDRSKFEPILIGITRDGKWMLLPLDYPLAMVNKRLPSITGNYPEVTRTRGALGVNGEKLPIDIIFPVLHGTYGEDGQLQRELALVAIKYVGSAAAASEIAMDKAESKIAFARSGIKGAPGVTVTQDQWRSNPAEIEESVKSLGLPLFVKAARGGSSRGTVKVKSYQDFSAAMAEAFSYDSKVLIESAIVGAEVECAVLRVGREVKASLPGKVWIDPHFEFYDFEAKYLDGATRIDIPAPFDPLVIRAIREYAIKAFRAIGASGLARVDFFVTPTNEIIINEINTMPGFTPTSAFPKMWAASGIAYKELITILLT
ncbi:DdlA D-alanine-D-alanine ligase and related ATP-grasp enzymes [Candidatus Nanopelagicaceae bacterium]